MVALNLIMSGVPVIWWLSLGDAPPTMHFHLHVLVSFFKLRTQLIGSLRNEDGNGNENVI